jgi:hypothetical protein
MSQRLTPGQITIGALAGINILLALYILGLAYIAYVDEELAFKLVELMLRVIGA